MNIKRLFRFPNRETLVSLLHKVSHRLSVAKQDVQNRITYFGYTTHKLTKRGKTWKNLIADVARLKKEVSDQKNTIASIEATLARRISEYEKTITNMRASHNALRNQDRELIFSLLHNHQQWAEQGIHADTPTKERLKHVISLAIQMAFFKAKHDVEKVYGRN